MPSTPDQPYKHDGWQGYAHWLDTGNVGVKNDHPFLSFKKVLLHARSLKLKGVKEWEQWRESDVRPASNPHTTYKYDAWQGYGHWQCLWRQKTGVPAVQEGAAARTLPPAEKPDRVAAVVQKRSTGGQHALHPAPNLQARRVARLWELAGHWQLESITELNVCG